MLVDLPENAIRYWWDGSPGIRQHSAVPVSDHLWNIKRSSFPRGFGKRSTHVTGAISEEQSDLLMCVNRKTRDQFLCLLRQSLVYLGVVRNGIRCDFVALGIWQCWRNSEGLIRGLEFTGRVPPRMGRRPYWFWMSEEQIKVVTEFTPLMRNAISLIASKT